MAVMLTQSTAFTTLFSVWRFPYTDREASLNEICKEREAPLQLKYILKIICIGRI